MNTTPTSQIDSNAIEKTAEFEGKKLPKLLSQADIDAVLKNYKKIETHYNEFIKATLQQADAMNAKQIVEAIRTSPDITKYNELLKQNGMKSREPILACLLISQNYRVLKFEMELQAALSSPEDFFRFLGHPKMERYMRGDSKDEQADMLEDKIYAITNKDDCELIEKNADKLSKIFGK